MSNLNEDMLLETDDEQKPTSQPSNLDLMKFMEKMRSDLCTKNDLKELKTAVTSDIQAIDSKVNATKMDLDGLNRRLNEIEANNQLSTYRQELNKQKQLQHNISIMGIPAINGEVLKDIVCNILTTIECASANVAATYRTKGKNPMIVVKLEDYNSKSAILKAKAMKTVRLKDVIVNQCADGNNIVYINNHVTPYFGKLLQEGRQAMKDKKIHSCWLASSGCMLRLKEDSQPLGYRTPSELSKLINHSFKTSVSGAANGKRAIPLNSSAETSPMMHNNNTKKQRSGHERSNSTTRVGRQPKAASKSTKSKPGKNSL